MTEVDRRSYDLSDSQWANAKGVLNLLEAIDQVTTTLSGEKYILHTIMVLAITLWLV